MRATPLLGIALVACGSLSPRDPQPLPPTVPGAAHVGVRVEGVVTDRWGYVVPNAWVTVRAGSPHAAGAHDADCDGASHLPTRTRTSPTGEFSVVVDAGPREPFHACLEVEALPPPSFGLRENAFVLPNVTFTTAGAAGGGDAVRAHVVLY